MTAPYDITHYSVLTGMIDEQKPELRFVKDLLFSQETILPTDTMEISDLEAGRVAGPFVELDSSAVPVPGLDESSRQYNFPYMRLKKSFTASKMMFQRRAGEQVYQTQFGTISQAGREHMERELAFRNRMIDNREEEMCAQATFTGGITYQKAGYANFTVDFDQLYVGSGEIALSAGLLWSNTSTGNPELQFRDAKRKMSAEHGVVPNIVLMGQAAAEALITHPTVREIINRDANLNAGSINLGANPDGLQHSAIYHGRLMGIDIWEYDQSIEDFGGATTPIVPANKAFFLHTSPIAQRVMYYAPIPDWDAFEGGMAQSRRFAKTWKDNDPSYMTSMVAARPLPIPRRKAMCIGYDVL